MIDFRPATSRLADLVAGVRDDQLTGATPCTESTVGDLVDHVNGFAQAFALAAAKGASVEHSQPVAPSAGNLGGDWRDRVPRLVVALGDAWALPHAWEGTSVAGGQELPAVEAGVIALDEVIVHGWDIAVSSGQPFDCDVALVEAALGFVTPTVGRSPKGTPGLFGPPVPVAVDAPLLDRLIGLTGRDPSWRP